VGIASSLLGATCARVFDVVLRRCIEQHSYGVLHMLDGRGAQFDTASCRSVGREYWLRSRSRPWRTPPGPPEGSRRPSIGVTATAPADLVCQPLDALSVPAGELDRRAGDLEALGRWVQPRAEARRRSSRQERQTVISGKTRIGGSRSSQISANPWRARPVRHPSACPTGPADPSDDRQVDEGWSAGRRASRCLCPVSFATSDSAAQTAELGCR
jgi:hypothetical protein